MKETNQAQETSGNTGTESSCLGATGTILDMGKLFKNEGKNQKKERKNQKHVCTYKVRGGKDIT